MRIDRLKGGLADDMQPEDFNPRSLKKGIRVELEHTDDEDLALEIAMDHLSEDPDYYEKLAAMEAKRNPKSHFKVRDPESPLDIMNVLNYLNRTEGRGAVFSKATEIFFENNRADSWGERSLSPAVNRALYIALSTIFDDETVCQYFDQSYYMDRYILELKYKLPAKDCRYDDGLYINAYRGSEALAAIAVENGCQVVKFDKILTRFYDLENRKAEEIGSRGYFSADNIVFASKYPAINFQSGQLERPFVYAPDVRWKYGEKPAYLYLDLEDASEDEYEEDEEEYEEDDGLAHLYYLNVGHHDSAYGGPEEGGWYFSTYTPYAIVKYKTLTRAEASEIEESILSSPEEIIQSLIKQYNISQPGVIMEQTSITLNRTPQVYYPQTRPRFE